MENKVKDEKYGVGKVFKNNEGDLFEIVEKLDRCKRAIKFIGYDSIKITQTTSIRQGRMKNYEKPSVAGVGFIGIGEYEYKIDKKNNKAYELWRSLIKRCYLNSFHEKHPSYKNIIVCDEWHNFQNFAKWYEDNFPKHIKDIKFELDKDLLQEGVENKIYSPDTAIFLPKKVNLFLLKDRYYNFKVKGISFDSSRRLWTGGTKDFYTGKNIAKRFKSKEEAINFYHENKKEQIEIVKKYLRELNYLPEKIIELVR